MARGRKKIPTKIKELQGTLKSERKLDNEMLVSLVAAIPSAPKWLSDIGKKEWTKVCVELFNKQMLHQIDLRLLEAYCNAISLHIETEIYLRENGRIQEFKNPTKNKREYTIRFINQYLIKLTKIIFTINNFKVVKKKLIII